jgi:uncharacterized RDD family membrane protein YckC
VMREHHYGGFWRRAVAYGVDKTILQIICLILLLSGMLATGLSLSAYQRGHGGGLFGSILDGPFLAFYYAVTVFVDMVYFTWFHGATGETPGKMLMKLRVVQPTGDPISFGTAFLRWAGYIVSSAVVCIGFIWVSFDRRKQAWHDKIAGTIVVRTEQRDAVVEAEAGDGPVQKMP